MTRLWQYDNKSLFECDTFHHCPDHYDSWDDFISDEKALVCNCIYGNPLLYWYWDNNDEGLDSEDFEYEITEENFKRIILIYRSWFNGLGKINIIVTPQDEPKIRKFIYDQQHHQYVKVDKKKKKNDKI